MFFLSAVVNGLLFGGVLSLLALGLNLVFGVVQVIHFFYGQCLMVGLYLIFVLTMLCHFPFIISCLIAVVVILILNIIVHLAVIQPLLKAPMINQFLALAAVMVILENLCLAVFGPSHRGVPIDLPTFHIGELYFSAGNLIAFCGSLIVLGLLYLFLNKTYTGLAIRAVAQNAEAAAFMGINPKVVYLITLGLGGALAGIVAGFFAPMYAVYPYFGGSFTLLAFVIVVLGGMGNLLGGLLASFIIGLVTMIVSSLTSAEVGAIAAYAVFLIVILVRPQGLLGARVGA